MTKKRRVLYGLLGVLCLGVAVWWHTQRGTNEIVSSADSSLSSMEQPPLPTPMEITLDKRLNYYDRREGLRKLGNDLCLKDRNALELLIHDATDDPSVRNDAIEVMVRQLVKPRNLGKDLISMYHESDKDPVWRNFCVQHMATVYAIDSTRPELEKELSAISESDDASNASTALLSMARIGQDYPHMASSVRRVAQRYLDEEMTGDRGIVAFQLAAADSSIRVLERARRTVQDKKAEIFLRMAASAVLGERGIKQDLPILIKLGEEDDSRLKRAANLNLSLLKTRLAKEI